MLIVVGSQLVIPVMLNVSSCPNVSFRVCWQGLLFCELVSDSVKFTVLTDVLAAKHKEAQERPSMLLDLCSQRSNSKVSGDNEGMKQYPSIWPCQEVNVIPL